jgi:hypothetical protein
MTLGGQAGSSSRIENYPGYPAGLSSFELATRILVQGDKFGARTAVPQEAVTRYVRWAEVRQTLAKASSQRTIYAPTVCLPKDLASVTDPVRHEIGAVIPHAISDSPPVRH